MSRLAIWNIKDEVKVIWKRIGDKMEKPSLFDPDYKHMIKEISAAIIDFSDADAHLTACQVMEAISTWCVKFAGSTDDAIAVGLALADQQILTNIGQFLRSGEAATRWPIISLCATLENIMTIPWNDTTQKLHILRMFFSPETRLYDSVIECCRRHGDSLTVCTIKVVETLVLTYHAFVSDDLAAAATRATRATIATATATATATASVPTSVSVSCSSSLTRQTPLPRRLYTIDGTPLSGIERDMIENCYSHVIPDLLALLSGFKNCPDAQEQVLRTVSDVLQGTELKWMESTPHLQLQENEIIQTLLEICSDYCANYEKLLNLAATALVVVKNISRLDRDFRTNIAADAKLVSVCLEALRCDPVALARGSGGGSGGGAAAVTMVSMFRRSACAVLHNVCLEPQVAERLCFLEIEGKTDPFAPPQLSKEVIATLRRNNLFKDLHLIRTLIASLAGEKDARIFRDVWVTISLLARYPQNVNALLDSLVHEVILECICLHLKEATSYGVASNVIIKTWTLQGPEVCALVTLARICGICCNPQFMSSSEAHTAMLNKIYRCLRSPIMLRVLQYLASLNPLVNTNGHTEEDIGAIQFLGMMCLSALYGRRGSEVVVHVADLLSAHRKGSHRYSSSIITALRRVVDASHASDIVRGGSCACLTNSSSSSGSSGSNSNGSVDAVQLATAGSKWTKVDKFFCCQVNWLLYSLSNLCVNWCYSRALSTCEDLIETLGLMLGRFRAAVGNGVVGYIQSNAVSIGATDEYWRDSSLLECLLLCLLHLYLSLPPDNAATVAVTPADQRPIKSQVVGGTYEVVVEKGGPGVALGMMVAQDKSGVIRLKSIRKSVIVHSLSAEAGGCMRAGDMLVGIGDHDIRDWDLAAAVVELSDKKIPQGSTVRLTYQRPMSRSSYQWRSEIQTHLEGLLFGHFKQRLNPAATASASAIDTSAESSSSASSSSVMTDTSVEYALLLYSLMCQCHDPTAALCRNPVFDSENNSNNNNHNNSNIQLKQSLPSNGYNHSTTASIPQSDSSSSSSSSLSSDGSSSSDTDSLSVWLESECYHSPANNSNTTTNASKGTGVSAGAGMDAKKTVLVCHSADRRQLADPSNVGGSIANNGAVFSTFLQSLREQSTIRDVSVVTSMQLKDVLNKTVIQLAFASDATVASLRFDCCAMLKGLVGAVKRCDAVAQCLTETYKYDPYCRVISNVAYHIQRQQRQESAVGPVGREISLSNPNPNRRPSYNSDSSDSLKHNVHISSSGAGAAAPPPPPRVCSILLSKSFSPQSACKESLRLFQEDAYTQRILLGNKDMVKLPSDRASELPYPWLPLWRRDNALTSQVDVINSIETVLQLKPVVATAAYAQTKQNIDTPLRNNYPLLAYMLSNPAAAAAKKIDEQQNIVYRFTSATNAARRRWEELNAVRAREAEAEAARKAEEQAAVAAALERRRQEEEQDKLRESQRVAALQAEADAARVRAEAVAVANKHAVAKAEALKKKQAAAAFTLTNIFNWWGSDENDDEDDDENDDGVHK